MYHYLILINHFLPFLLFHKQEDITCFISSVHKRSCLYFTVLNVLMSCMTLMGVDWHRPMRSLVSVKLTNKRSCVRETKCPRKIDSIGNHAVIENYWNWRFTCIRVQLIIKKFKIFFGGKTVATIYQIKTKFVNVFGFLYISKCSEFTIFGVKVNLKSVDPKCSYLACRILQISYYLPK